MHCLTMSHKKDAWPIWVIFFLLGSYFACILVLSFLFIYFKRVHVSLYGRRVIMPHTCRLSGSEYPWIKAKNKVTFTLYFFPFRKRAYLKTYAAISNAHLFRVCKRGKLSGSCLSTLNGFGSTQLPIFLCHIRVPTFSSQNN